MNSDAILILKCIFQNIWRLFTSWKIPGTFVTPLGWALFATFAGLSIRFICRVSMTYDSSSMPLSSPSDVHRAVTSGRITHHWKGKY